MTGGKDLMIWLINAVNGKVMASFAGHEDEVNCAYFTLEAYDVKLQQMHCF